MLGVTVYYELMGLGWTEEELLDNEDGGNGAIDATDTVTSTATDAAAYRPSGVGSAWAQPCPFKLRGWLSRPSDCLYAQKPARWDGPAVNGKRGFGVRVWELALQMGRRVSSTTEQQHSMLRTKV